MDDVRSEQEPRVERLVEKWRSIAPSSQAAVIQFEFDAGQDDVWPLLNRVSGFSDQRRVVIRQTLDLDWLSYFCTRYELLARDCNATFVSCRIVEDPLGDPYPPGPAEIADIAEPVGVSFQGEADENVDDWSRAVFRQLQGWSAARDGKWTRWGTPGCLVLEIERHEGTPIDPIVLETSGDELTVSFGSSHQHFNGPDYLGEGDDAEKSTREAKRLVEDWLSGHIRTAVFWRADNQWCGSMVVDPNAPLEEIMRGANWLKQFSPTRVELRAPERKNWRFFNIRIDGTIEETDPPSPVS